MLGFNALRVECLNIEFLRTFCRSERGFTQLVFNRASLELPAIDIEGTGNGVVTNGNGLALLNIDLYLAIAGIGDRRNGKPRPATREDAITAVANKRLLICTSFGVVGPPFDTESPLIHSSKSLWDYDLIKVTGSFYVPSTVGICRQTVCEWYVPDTSSPMFTLSFAAPVPCSYQFLGTNKTRRTPPTT